MPVWRRARQRKLAASPRRRKVLEGVEHRNIHSFIHSPNQQLLGRAPSAGERTVTRQNFLLLGRGHRKICEQISSWKCEGETQAGSRPSGRTVRREAGTRSVGRTEGGSVSWEKDESEGMRWPRVSESRPRRCLSPALSSPSPQGLPGFWLCHRKRLCPFLNLMLVRSYSSGCFVSGCSTLLCAVEIHPAACPRGQSLKPLLEAQCGCCVEVSWGLLHDPPELGAAGTGVRRAG